MRFSPYQSCNQKLPCTSIWDFFLDFSLRKSKQSNSKFTWHNWENSETAYTVHKALKVAKHRDCNASEEILPFSDQRATIKHMIPILSRKSASHLLVLVLIYIQFKFVRMKRLLLKSLSMWIINADYSYCWASQPYWFSLLF